MPKLNKTLQQSKAARETHKLERADIGSSQGMETKRGSKGDSPAGEGRRRDWSGHANKAWWRGELTIWER